MPLRFKVLATVSIVMMLLAQEEGLHLFETYHAGAIALGLLLVFSVIALWPNSSRADRVDRSVGQADWSDRIRFDSKRASD